MSRPQSEGMVLLPLPRAAFETLTLRDLCLLRLSGFGPAITLRATVSQPTHSKRS